MDNNEDRVDDSQIEIKCMSTIAGGTTGCIIKPNNTDPASLSVTEPDAVSKEMQKDIAEYNDNLFWNIRY
jgi:hypothetical protein